MPFIAGQERKINEIKARTLGRSRQPQAKASRTPGGIHSGMSLPVKKEHQEGLSLVLRLSSLRISSLRTIFFFSTSCVSIQHSWGGLTFLTDSGHLDLNMNLMRPTGALEIFPMTVNIMASFRVMLTGFKILQEMPLGVSVRVFPQWLKRNHSEQDQHHPVGWDFRVNERGIGESQANKQTWLQHDRPPHLHNTTSSCILKLGAKSLPSLNCFCQVFCNKS